MRKAKVYSTNIDGRRHLIKAFSMKQIAEYLGKTLYSLRPHISSLGFASKGGPTWQGSVDIDLTTDESKFASLLKKAWELTHESVKKRRKAKEYLYKAARAFFIEFLIAKGQDKTDLSGLSYRELTERVRSTDLSESDQCNIQAIEVFLAAGDLSWAILRLEELVEKHLNVVDELLPLRYNKISEQDEDQD